MEPLLAAHSIPKGSFPMTSLRQRMTEDMQVRNLALNTQMSYLQQVSLFARHFNKSPEQLGPADIRAYQVYLTNEKKLAPGSVVIAVAALHRWSDVKAQVDPCRTWRRGWSTPPPSDRHLGVRGCMLHPGAIPRHLAIQTGNNRPTAAACRVHNGTPSGARREVVSECCRRRIRKAAPVSAERQ